MKKRSTKKQVFLPKNKLREEIVSFRVREAEHAVLQSKLTLHPVGGVESVSQFVRKLGLDYANGKLIYVRPEDYLLSTEAWEATRMISPKSTGKQVDVARLSSPGRVDVVERVLSKSTFFKRRMDRDGWRTLTNRSGTTKHYHAFSVAVAYALADEGFDVIAQNSNFTRDQVIGRAYLYFFAPVAQCPERRASNAEVAGEIPAGSTI